MFTIEKRVGRLVEGVMRGRVTLAELDAANGSMERILSALPGLAIVIADYRRTKFLLEEDAVRLGQMYRHHNDRIERSAILVSELSAIGVLQMERVIREAKYPSRRAFRDAREAASWLDEVLDMRERARLRAALLENATNEP